MPVQTLIEYLEGGDTIDDFLEGFPTVTRQQVIAFLEEAKGRVVAAASGKYYSTNVRIAGSLQKFLAMKDSPSNIAQKFMHGSYATNASLA